MRFRYVTPAFFGRWHNDRDAAVKDAIRAGQAVRDNGRVKWCDDAWLETEDGEKHRSRPADLGDS